MLWITRILPTNLVRIHCDVKPENILEIDGKYKLADPGFANFTLKRSEDVFNMPVKALKGYTYTYGMKALSCSHLADGP